MVWQQFQFGLCFRFLRFLSRFFLCVCVCVFLYVLSRPLTLFFSSLSSNFPLSLSLPFALPPSLALLFSALRCRPLSGMDLAEAAARRTEALCRDYECWRAQAPFLYEWISTHALAAPRSVRCAVLCCAVLCCAVLCSLSALPPSHFTRFALSFAACKQCTTQ